jgi:uroporphyrin-3 C-methyltransferase
VEDEKEPELPAVAESSPSKDTQVTETSPADKAATVSNRKGGGLAWLALFLSLAALGVTAWLYLQMQREDPALQSRLSDLQNKLAASEQQLQRAGEALRGESRQNLAQLQARFDSYQAQQQAALESLQAGLRSQRQRLLEMSSADRSDWSLAEAEYLLRLAHQRLLMAGDVRSAVALLASADAILQELDDVALLDVRRAVATDLAALRAVAPLDIDGTWLRLQALAGEVDKLLLFELSEAAVELPEPAVDAGWQERLEHGFSAAAAKLSAYLVIRRRDTPYQPLMDPQWERLVRQNLRMLLAQAQSALLSGNELLFRESLAASRRWLSEFFNFNEAGVSALDAELDALSGLDITREYPDISGSMAAVKTAINSRHAAAGGP